MARKSKKRTKTGPQFCPHLVPRTPENGYQGCFLCQRVDYGESIDQAPFACPNHPEIVAYRDADAEWQLDCNCDHGDWDEMATQSRLTYTNQDGMRFGMRYTDHRCPRCDAPAALVGATWHFPCGHYTGEKGVPFYRVVGTPKQCACGRDIPPEIDGEPWRGDQCPRCTN